MHILSERGVNHMKCPSQDVFSSASTKKRSTIAAHGALLSLLSLFSVATYSAEPSPTASAVTDGPYVFLDQGQENTAYWICQSELKQTPIANNQLARPSDCGNLPQPVRHNEAPQVEADTYTHAGKIVALSDVHGQFDVMINLLKAHKIIDDQHHWAFGDGHMVMTGDMFDRGHQVNEVLWFLYELDKEAQAAGGRLHLLMGNHEQMVFRGDLRYVNERYQTSAQLLNRSYDALYNKDTEIGRWLRSKNTMVKINNLLFMHGGISPEWVERKLNISDANQLFRQHLDDKKEDLKQNDLLNFLFFTNGPTWYRGYFKDVLNEQEIDQILNYFKVDHIIVGHTSQDRVLGLYHNKIIAIDSSIKNGQSGELLLIEQDKLTRGMYQGEQVPL
ncbi:metallophosphoesterase [Shewanella sp. MR-4]|uniref:metallophosphoesterase n=1 Tax=Shewanella sp. (strain MR-4) TaxID=60480 RepID=UPI00005E4D41|nr:metallophosphoesterase [Shewanella sp. MR-4]ABI38166.1 metallophosphoesterase [Shewanella sp. MR-4]